MADVQFNEETTLAAAPVVQRKGSSMAAWLVRAKWAKDEKQAEFILIGIAVVAFATMLFVLLFGSLRPQPEPLNPLELQAMPGAGSVR